MASADVLQSLGDKDTPNSGQTLLMETVQNSV